MMYNIEDPIYFWTRKGWETDILFVRYRHRWMLTVDMLKQIPDLLECIAVGGIEFFLRQFSVVRLIIFFAWNTIFEQISKNWSLTLYDELSLLSPHKFIYLDCFIRAEDLSKTIYLSWKGKCLRTYHSPQIALVELSYFIGMIKVHSFKQVILDDYMVLYANLSCLTW